MTITSWILFGALCLCVQAAAPPIVTALQHSQGGDADSDHDQSLAVPEKRLFKYLLPSTQSWGDSAGLIHTGQEGTKRGYVDRNFLRFGRSGGEKRGPGNNFLRFGRGGSFDYESAADAMEDAMMPTEKRNRNFLRFGRAGYEDASNIRTPLNYALGIQDDEVTSEEKRARNFLRFGRGGSRVGHDTNFVRFGRSVDGQTLCDDDCDVEKSQHSKTASVSSYSSSVHDEADSDANKHSGDDSSSKSESEVHRYKRGTPEYADYAVVPSHGPGAWAGDFQTADDGDDEGAEDYGLEALTGISKRSNIRNYGPNRIYQRPLKRVSSNGVMFAPPIPKSMVVMSPIETPRVIRGPKSHFIRFG